MYSEINLQEIYKFIFKFKFIFLITIVITTVLFYLISKNRYIDYYYLDINLSLNPKLIIQTKSNSDTATILLNLSGLDGANELQRLNRETLLDKSTIIKFLEDMSSNESSFYQNMIREYKSYLGFNFKKLTLMEEYKITLRMHDTSKIDEKFENYFISNLNNQLLLLLKSKTNEFNLLISEIETIFTRHKNVLEKTKSLNQLRLEMMTLFLLSSKINLPEETSNQINVERSRISNELLDIIRQIKINYLNEFEKNDIFNISFKDQLKASYSMFFRTFNLLGFIISIILSFLISLFYQNYVLRK